MSRKSILFFVLCALILVIVGRRANAQSAKPTFSDTSDATRNPPSTKWVRIPAPDTVHKTDTVYKGVPLYQSFDTTAMVYVTRSNRPVLKPCFVVRAGFKQQGPKGLQWVEEPQISAVYSKRWKKIDGKKIGRLL